jgi:hypothetical protein
MRFRNSGVLALMLMASCSSDASGPGSGAAVLPRPEHTLLAGRVLGLSAGPDSTLIPLGGAEIVVYRVDSIPTDTVPVDTVPGDTMLWSGLAVRPYLGDLGMLDSIPVDTIPPDTMPVDTIPVDTIPTDSTPPPPPPSGCGRTGEVVTRVLTRPGGRFRIQGLPPAKYDLRITPASGAPFGRTFYCGVHLIERQPVELTIYTFATQGED